MLMIYGRCTLFFTIFASIETIFTLNLLPNIMLLFSALNRLIAYVAFAEALEHWEAS